MEHNVTEASDITTTESSSKAYIMDSVMFLISLVGMAGNSMAMFILTSSVKIRKSKSYVLLMNQCLLDFTTTLFTITYLPLKYFVQWSRITGSWDLIMCHVIYSQLYITMPIFSSSYNLVAMSVERMTSIVWPIIHKVRCTRRLNLFIAATTWFLGFGIATAFSLPVNGIDPVGRTCYYWTQLPSRLHVQIFSVCYNTLYSILPLLVMLISYAVMCARIVSRSMRLGVKLNVARMLATCVLLFLCCHVIKVTLVMIANFSSIKIDFQGALFVVGNIMVQMNSIVNPFIYSFQYMDYKTELRRQICIITGRICGNRVIYVESTSSSYVNSDNK